MPTPEVHPVTPLQEGMVLLSLREPEAGYYHAIEAYRLRGPFDAGAFRAALWAAARRHAVLRTSFRVDNGSVEQVVHEGVELPCELLDWSADVGDEHVPSVDEHRERFLGQDHRRGFDLFQPPLLRCAVAHIGSDLYELVCSYHHAVLDAHSYGMVVDDICRAYSAAVAVASEDDQKMRRAAEVELACQEAPVPFRTFVDWLAQQRDSFEGTESAAATHWNRILSTLAEPTPLPYPLREARAGRRMEEVTVEVAPKNVVAINRFLSEHGLRLQTLIIGAWAVVCARHAGSRDVVIGLTVPTRPRDLDGAKSIVGLMINGIPVRVALPPDARPPAWLEAIEAMQSETRPHTWVEPARLQRMSAIPGDQSVFATLLAFQHPYADLKLSDSLRMTHVRSLGRPDNPLSIVTTFGEETLKLRALYEEPRLTHDLAVELLRQLEHVAVSLAENPEAELASISLVRGDQVPQSPAMCEVRTGYPRDANLTSLFDAQALRRRDEVALVHADVRVSYGELEARANRLAHHLVRRGAAAGDRVGLRLERGIDAIAAVLAIVKAGAAYVPLDTADPPSRTAAVAANADLRLIVTTSALTQGLPEGLPVCELDGSAAAIASEPATAPAIESAALDPAYVMYTSGSTGDPKGVAVPHRGIVRLAVGGDYITLGDDDRVAQLASLAFDASTFEIWGALLNGASVFVLDDARLLSPRLLAEQLERHKITTLFLTTSLFDLMAAECPEGLAPLRTLLFGGEVARVENVRRLLDAKLPLRLVHCYGPTEATTFSTWYEVKLLSEKASSVPIGRAISNGTASVRDGELQPLPRGVVGELCLGGDGLALGYFGRPDQTAERFAADPAGKTEAAGTSDKRLYRSGDLAVLRDDGALEFVGRMDAQIKLHGFRIEPGEIEAHLARHRDVRQSAVVRYVAGEISALAVFLVASKPLSVAALRAFLKDRVPGYMIPSRVANVDELPLTSGGKIDRKALARTAAAIGTEAGSEPNKGGRGPRDALEKTLCGIFREAVGAETVAATDDFFALGGDSLSALRAHIAMEAALRREIAADAIYSHRTVGRLAVSLRGVGETTRPDNTLTRRQLTELEIVTVNPKGSRPPIFCFNPHPDGMIAAIPADQPVHCAWFNVGRVLGPSLSVEELAEDYLRAVRERQPQGPYALMGFSFGGLVAYEIARRLTAAGEALDVLALIDPTHASTTNSSETVRSKFPLLGVIQRLKRRRALAQRRRHLLEAIAAGRNVAPASIKTCLHDMLFEAALRYGHPRHGGCVLLFLPESVPDEAAVPTGARWSKAAGANVNEHVVRGTQGHIELMHEPCISEICSVIETERAGVTAASEGAAGS